MSDIHARVGHAIWTWRHYHIDPEIAQRELTRAAWATVVFLAAISAAVIMLAPALSHSHPGGPADPASTWAEGAVGPGQL